MAQSRTRRDSQRPELVIVGAGPAGVAAALWGTSQGLTPTVIEADAQPGGQLKHVHFHPRELPGIESGDGPAIAATYARQLEAAGVELHNDVVATALEGSSAQPCVMTATGTRFEGDAVLIVSGVRRRRLGVPGEDLFEGRGVSFSATLDRAHFAGHEVVVVGGGDAAFENALLLAEVQCRVTLAVRATARARREFRTRVADHPLIKVLEHTRVLAFEGDGRVERVQFEGREGRFDRPASGVVIKVGVIPNTEWCRDVVEIDGEGFLRVDHRFRTARERVWAAGDVTGPPLPAITVAIGQAATAIGDIRDTLVG